VTVVVCAYNYARFLPFAIDSALAQSHENVEVVVVDDGSTDDTPAVLARYGERLRVVTQANAGLTAATTRGIAEARGEYVAILDADDIWHVEKLRRQVGVLLARPEVGLVYSDMELMDADGRQTAPSYFRHHDLDPPRGRALGAFLQQNFAPAPSIIFRRSLVNHLLPFPPEAWCQDWWLALRTAEVAEIEVVDEPLVRYRIHSDNMNGGTSGQRLLPTLRQDNSFRRWMLGHLDLSGVTPFDVRRAWVRFEQNTAYAAQIAGQSWLEEITGQGRDPGACRALLSDGRVLPALTADPLDPDARRAFDGETLPPAERVAWAEERVQEGDLAAAAAALRAVADTVEDDDLAALAGTDLAVIALTQGDVAGCRAAAGRALRRDPDRLEALEVLGQAAERAGDHAEALRWFQRATVVAPDDEACRLSVQRAQGALSPAR